MKNLEKSCYVEGELVVGKEGHSPKMRLNSSIAVIIGILALSFIIRAGAFYLPHDNGDQVFHLGLAMKLDRFGFEGYNIRGIDIWSNPHLLLALPSSQGSKGSLLEALAESGVFYYDEPLYHLPPAFPYALMLSHRIFSPKKPYVAVRTNLGKDVLKVHPRPFLTAQFYAVIIPLLFSLLFIFSVFVLTRLLFSDNIALYASALVAISPIEILCSQKLWADSMLSFFVILGVVLFFIARRKDNWLYAILAGVAVGIATLTKQSGGFVAIAIFGFHLWVNRARLRGRGVTKVIFEKNIVSFGLAVFIVTLPWFYIVTKTYGFPWYQPHQPGIAQSVDWFRIVSSRPWYTYLVGIPYQVPLYVLLYPGVCTIFRDREKRESGIFLLIWLLVFVAIFHFYLHSKEHRYMLPVYPVIAIFSAFFLEKVRKIVNRKFKFPLGEVVIGILIILCACWSVRIGLLHAFSNQALIRMPF
jgi:hypothetical protein